MPASVQSAGNRAWTNRPGGCKFNEQPTGSSMCLAQHCPVKLPMIMEIFMYLGFPAVSVVKNSPGNAGDMGLISESRRSPGGGHGSPLQCPCLENSHGQRSLAGYSQSMRLQRVRHDWVCSIHAMQLSSPLPHVSIGLLKCGLCDWGPEFLI